MRGALLRVATTVLAAVAPVPALAFLIGIPPPDPSVTTVNEWVNEITGHYFLSAVPNGNLSATTDDAMLWAGAAGPGWHQTGYTFTVFTPGYGKGVSFSRFYAPGPNSHFYTSNAAELAAVRAPGSGWIDEGIKFDATVPQSGSGCGAAYSIHRLYNNRFAYNDSAHRYVFDDSVRSAMLANGWVDEGVVLCASSVYRPSQNTFWLYATDIRTAADCENEALNRGPCIGMNALPEPVHDITGPVSQDWDYTYGQAFGLDYDLYTAQSPADHPAVLAHSYVQGRLHPALGEGVPGAMLGLHVSSLDAATPLASIDPVYQFTTMPPGVGQVDLRIFPWRHADQNWIGLSYELANVSVKRADSQSHGYGAVLIEFRDVRSGQTIVVSLLAYGTIPPGDFVGVQDPSTGAVWVSTTIGGSMLFGKSTGDGYMACSGSGGCPLPAGLYTTATYAGFGFALTAADFSGIVARARAVDGRLSADNGDYILARYMMRNGILGNADLQAKLQYLELTIYGGY